MRRGTKRQSLDERYPKREPGPGIVGEALLRGTVDQPIEVGKAAKRLGGNGVRERAVVGSVEVTGGSVERRLQRQALAEDRV